MMDIRLHLSLYYHHYDDPLYCTVASSSNNLNHYNRRVSGVTPTPSQPDICLSFKEKMIILTAAISRVTWGIVQSKCIAIQLS